MKYLVIKRGHQFMLLPIANLDAGRVERISAFYEVGEVRES